jgi:hypothetical protein
MMIKKVVFSVIFLSSILSCRIDCMLRRLRVSRSPKRFLGSTNNYLKRNYFFHTGLRSSGLPGLTGSRGFSTKQEVSHFQGTHESDLDLKRIEEDIKSFDAKYRAWQKPIAFSAKKAIGNKATLVLVKRMERIAQEFLEGGLLPKDLSELRLKFLFNLLNFSHSLSKFTKRSWSEELGSLFNKSFLAFSEKQATVFLDKVKNDTGKIIEEIIDEELGDYVVDDLKKIDRATKVDLYSYFLDKVKNDTGKTIEEIIDEELGDYVDDLKKVIDRATKVDLYSYLKPILDSREALKLLLDPDSEERISLNRLLKEREEEKAFRDKHQDVIQIKRALAKKLDSAKKSNLEELFISIMQDPDKRIRFFDFDSPERRAWEEAVAKATRELGGRVGRKSYVKRIWNQIKTSKVVKVVKESVFRFLLEDRAQKKERVRKDLEIFKKKYGTWRVPGRGFFSAIKIFRNIDSMLRGYMMHVIEEGEKQPSERPFGFLQTLIEFSREKSLLKERVWSKELDLLYDNTKRDSGKKIERWLDGVVDDIKENIKRAEEFGLEKELGEMLLDSKTLEDFLNRDSFIRSDWDKKIKRNEKKRRGLVVDGSSWPGYLMDKLTGLFK